MNMCRWLLRSYSSLTLRSSQIAAAALTLAINLSHSRLADKLGIKQITGLEGLNMSIKCPLRIWKVNSNARKITGLTVEDDLKPAYSILLAEADLYNCKGMLASDPSLYLNENSQSASKWEDEPYHMLRFKPLFPLYKYNCNLHRKRAFYSFHSGHLRHTPSILFISYYCNNFYALVYISFFIRP